MFLLLFPKFRDNDWRTTPKLCLEQDENCLSAFENQDHSFTSICYFFRMHFYIIGRYHIYSSKVKKTLPNLHVFSQTFLKCQEIEKCLAYKTKAGQMNCNF